MATPLPLLPTAVECCAPLTEAPLTPEQADALARRLKALADPVRLRLVSILLASPDQEACTCDLVGPLGLTQPTVSHHLKKLAEAGIVTGERRGVWTHYRVSTEAISALLAMLSPLR
ncbi:MAG: helix-turn-helix transcriptional regulator [Actinobacteria bacterium]|nr:helix-turn-helix transcriptional regulator [Actinomycetota bacterium]